MLSFDAKKLSWGRNVIMQENGIMFDQILSLRVKP
jgi:hypothetical protein